MTERERAVAEAGITGTVEVVCFVKGWNAAIKAAGKTATQLADSVHEHALGGMIASGIASIGADSERVGG